MTSSSKYFQYFVLLAATPSTLCFAAAESVHCGVLLCVTVYLCMCVCTCAHVCIHVSTLLCVFMVWLTGAAERSSSKLFPLEQTRCLTLTHTNTTHTLSHCH